MSERNRERRGKAGGARRDPSPKRRSVIGRTIEKKKTNIIIKSSSEPSSTCRLSNIPRNVTQRELTSLFEKFKDVNVTLFHDYKGRSTGIAEADGHPRMIGRVIKEFSEVQIDGRSLDVKKLENGKEIIRRRAKPNGKERERRRRIRGGETTKTRETVERKSKPKITSADLDKELDEYMNRKTEEAKQEKEVSSSTS